MQSPIGLLNLEKLSKSMKGEYFIERLRMLGGASPPFLKDLQNSSSIHILDDSLTSGSVPVEKELPRPNGEVIRSSGMLGRLSLKFEAAGKIRVFAMVDA